MNVLPLLLLGGAAAYMVTSGNKKKSVSFIEVSNDCSSIKVMGLPFEELENKAKTLEESGTEEEKQKFKSKFENSLKKFGTEDLELASWFKKYPITSVKDLDGLTMAISQWKYPQCNITDDIRAGTVAFKVFILTFTVVTFYAITNKILTTKDILDGLGDFAGSFGTFPEGTSASIQLPAPLRMVLNV